MKKLLLALAIVLPLSVMAQDVKVGYINAQAVMMLMPEISDVEKEMATFNEQNKKYLEEMQAEVQKKYEAYQNDQATLSDAMKKVREEEIYSMQERLQTTYQTLQQEAQTKQANLLKPIQDKLKNAIESVGQKNNFLFILDELEFLYKSPKAVDVTPLVKKELGIL